MPRPASACWRSNARSDGAFLGICGLSHEQWYPDDLQIGWRLFQQYLGSGLRAGSRAGLARSSPLSRGASRLISISDVPNQRSHKVMQRLGMRYDHTATLSDDRETFDAHVYVLTRKDWIALRKL